MSDIPEFLADLLNARSPSGAEGEAQAVVDRHCADAVDGYQKDALGSRFLTVNPAGKPSLMMSGHFDELGLMIKYIDKQGFLYFECVGGIDLNLIAGRRVSILTEQGVVLGVTGKRAIHLLSAEERKKVPELHNLWIDIGVSSREEAEAKVSIGDVAVYDCSLQMLGEHVATARAFDNKTGAYAVLEAARRLKGDRDLQAKVVSVATAQEEVGCRGARVAVHAVAPDFAIAVDVGHATDHPECDAKKFGEFKLGKGPILTRGVNANPWVFRRLKACAEAAGIPYQVEAEARPCSNDGRELQMGRDGVATGVISIPLRYMHTPSEIVDLRDVEHTVQLLVAFAKSLTEADSGIW